MSSIYEEEPVEFIDEYKEKREDVRCLILGDKDVGKSSLWWTYFKREFPDPDHINRLRKEQQVNSQEIQYGDVTYSITMEDDDSSEGDQARIQKIKQVDVIILLFSIIDLRSFQSAKNKWLEEVRELNEDLPLVLVGNKIDLREEAASVPGLAPVTTEEGSQAFEDIGANGYAEISAKRKEGLPGLLHVIVDGILDGRNKKFQKERLREEGKRFNCLIM